MANWQIMLIIAGSTVAAYFLLMYLAIRYKRRKTVKRLVCVAEVSKESFEELQGIFRKLGQDAVDSAQSTEEMGSVLRTLSPESSGKHRITLINDKTGIGLTGVGNIIKGDDLVLGEPIQIPVEVEPQYPWIVSDDEPFFNSVAFVRELRGPLFDDDEEVATPDIDDRF